jgi:tRNA dimethylallyltransferase
MKNVIVTGPTATGKTRLAVKIAGTFGGEIISVDSRQVYCGLDIGTGKDLQEYYFNGESIPYHLIDIIQPSENYHLMAFRQDVLKALDDIHSRAKLPVLAGGTPLYIDSIISNYSMKGAPPDENFRNTLKEYDTGKLLELLKIKNPEQYEQLKDGSNRNRIIRYLEKQHTDSTAVELPEIPASMEWLIIGVFFHRNTVHKRIRERLDSRLEEGMVEEVKKLHENGLSWEKLEFFGLEYKYIALHLQGKLSFSEMRNQLLAKIRQFAKRQDIWFRKMEREGKKIYWIPEGDFQSAAEIVTDFLNGQNLPEPEIKISEIKY